MCLTFFKSSSEKPILAFIPNNPAKLLILSLNSKRTSSLAFSGFEGDPPLEGEETPTKSQVSKYILTNSFFDG